MCLGVRPPLVSVSSPRIYRWLNSSRGSWQERQICDADPFSLPYDDARSRTEFYLPLLFYLFDWLLFFMAIPRSWTAVEKQQSPSQAQMIARPSASDVRFKAGGFFALAAWIVTVYSFHHSISHYLPKNQILIEPAVKINNSLVKLLLGLSLSAVTVAYLVAGTWFWPISPLNLQVSTGWFFGLGYAPALLIIVAYNVFGHLQRNDDKALTMLRRGREQAIDQELGIGHAVRKASWWSKMSGQHPTDLTPEDRLRRLPSEIGGGPATTRKVEQALELKALREQLLDNEERGRGHEGKETESKSAYFVRGSSMLRHETPMSNTERHVSVAESSDGSDTSARSLQGNPQYIRSMLDV